MPFPTRTEQAEKLVKDIREKYFGKDSPDNLRAKLAAQTKGGVVVNTDRLKQLDILDTTLTQVEADQTSPRQDFHLTAIQQLQTIVGALLFVQVDIAEAYKVSYVAPLVNVASVGLGDYRNPDRSSLYHLINQIPELKICLNAKPSDIPSTIKDEKTKKPRKLTEAEVEQAQLSSRDSNMRLALRSFWNLYIKHAYNERVERDEKGIITEVTHLPNLGVNIFKDAFLHVTGGDESEAKVAPVEARFFRQLKRFQLHSNMGNYEQKAFEEPTAKYRKVPETLTAFRETVLSAIYKPEEPAQDAEHDKGSASKAKKSLWPSFWPADKKGDTEASKAAEREGELANVRTSAHV